MKTDIQTALELLLDGAEQAQRNGLNQPQVNGGIVLARAALAKENGAPLAFRNWKGDQVNAPKDLKHIVAKYNGDTIVWSRSGDKHQVRYALEVTPCGTSISAAEQFGYCVLHLEECNGKLKP